MERFKKILVVVDDPTKSQAALARGVQLARRSGAELSVLHALEGPGHGSGRAPRGFSEQKLVEFERGERLAELRELVRSVRPGEVEVGVKVAVGTPFVEVIREVIREGHDLVLKDAPARGELTGRLFTSLDMHLMRKCPCPLWMVKVSRRRRYRRVVAAIHPDVADTEHASLNRSVLDLAAAVAKLDGAELHVVHAWQLFGEEMLRSRRFSTSPEKFDAILDANRERVARELRTLVAKHPVPGLASANIHLVRGEAAPVLLRTVRELGADLLVMGTVARTGIAGLIIGNTAETVLDGVNCSVLALKPDGFVSPVRLPSEEEHRPVVLHTAAVRGLRAPAAEGRTAAEPA